LRTAHLYEKLSVSSRSEALTIAIRRGSSDCRELGLGEAEDEREASSKEATHRIAPCLHGASTK